MCLKHWLRNHLRVVCRVSDVNCTFDVFVRDRCLFNCCTIAWLTAAVAYPNHANDQLKHSHTWTCQWWIDLTFCCFYHRFMKVKPSLIQRHRCNIVIIYHFISFSEIKDRLLLDIITFKVDIIQFFISFETKRNIIIHEGFI